MATSKPLEEVAFKMKNHSSAGTIDIDEYANAILEQIRDGLGHQTEKNYYQLYDSLVLVEYLLLNEREELVKKLCALLSPIFNLKSYQCRVTPDPSQLIRDNLAKRIIHLLNNCEQLCNERIGIFEERNKAMFLPGVVNVSGKYKENQALIDEASFEITDILSKLDLDEDDKNCILSSLIDLNENESVLDNYAYDIAPKQFKKLNDIKTKIKILMDNSVKQSKNGTGEQFSISDRITRKNSPQRSSVMRFTQDETASRNRSVSSHNSTSSGVSSTVSILGSRQSSETTIRYIIIDGNNIAFK